MFMEVHANLQNIDKVKEEEKYSPTHKDWENSSSIQRRMEAGITSPKRGGEVPSWGGAFTFSPLVGWCRALSLPLLKWWCFPHSSSFGVVLPFCGVVLFRWIVKKQHHTKGEGRKPGPLPFAALPSAMSAFLSSHIELRLVFM